jgi:hypothetical protein
MVGQKSPPKKRQKMMDLEMEALDTVSTPTTTDLVLFLFLFFFLLLLLAAPRHLFKPLSTPARLSFLERQEERPVTDDRFPSFEHTKPHQEETTTVAGKERATPLDIRSQIQPALFKQVGEQPVSFLPSFPPGRMRGGRTVFQTACICARMMSCRRGYICPNLPNLRLPDKTCSM